MDTEFDGGGYHQVQFQNSLWSVPNQRRQRALLWGYMVCSRGLNVIKAISGVSVLVEKDTHILQNSALQDQNRRETKDFVSNSID